VVRSNHFLDQKEQSRIDEALAEIRETGFWNFFSFQRFVTPRLVGHTVGLELLRANYEEAAKVFIAGTGMRELPYFKKLRDTAREQWGNWAGLYALYAPLSFMLASETKMLAHLAQRPGDFIGAFHQIPDNTRLFVYGYNSYLFNKKLSALIKTGDVPLTLPFATSTNQTNPLYAEELKADGISLPSQAYRDLSFIKLTDPQVPTVQHAEDIEIRYEEDIAYISFFLPKGAYATSLLMNLFTLASDFPLPEKVTTRIVDTKKAIGQTGILPIMEGFVEPLRAWQKNLAKFSVETTL
jgi:tRNA(Glu) U13 pseudouridine synthase TruD